MFTKIRSGARRVALVGCSTRKLGYGAPARELYTSGLFRASIAYAEATCDELRIVSALHGAVKPDLWLEPYDRDLRGIGKKDREAWGARTVGEVIATFRVPPVLVILAGKIYEDALLYGAHWHNLPKPETPLRGISGCGARIARLTVETRKRIPPVGAQ